MKMFLVTVGFVDNLYSSGTFFMMEIEIIGWL